MTPRGWPLLWAALLVEKRSLLVLGGWSAIEAVPVAASGWLVAVAVDQGFLAGDLALGVLLLAAFGVLLVLGAFAGRQTMGPLAEIVETVRDRLVRQVVGASLRGAVRGDREPDGGAVTRITRQTEMARQMAAALLMVLRSVLFTVVAAVVGVLALVPELSAVVALALVASGMLLAVLSRILRRRLDVALAAEETLSTTAGAVLDGLRDVRVCGAGRTAGSEVGAAVDAQAAASMATARVGACRIGVIAVGARVPLLAALLLAPGLVSSGAASPGEVLGAAVYLVNGLEPALRQVVQTVGGTGLHLGVVLRRLAAMCAPVPAERPCGAAVPSRPTVALRGITFAYGPHSHPIVADLNLHLPTGRRLAVVGPSGIGKSTLANLLAGLEQPQRGEVHLGGHPLTDLDPASLRRAVALVPQESYVFAGTLRENLAQLAPDVTDEQLRAAVELFGLTPTASRAGGLDADLGSVAALSDGERQLITLARVHLGPAEVVILDEATCHLDPRTEMRVEEVFAARGATLVVIAHRIGAAARAEEILVMDGAGAVLGRHDDLLRCSPLYADLAGGGADLVAGSR